MKKKILIGVVFGIVIYLLNCLVLKGAVNVNNDINYYDNITFDFIIPRPWYTQISELEGLEFIDSVTPYYMTGKTADINGKNYNIDFYIVDIDAKLKNTPYSDSLLIEGGLPAADEILIDKKIFTIAEASIGDVVSMQIGDENISLKISGIVEANEFSSRPTALIYYNDFVKKGIESTIKHLSYSGAYVDVNNLASAETYFNKTYRAKGKIGERSWYKDDAAYNYIKESIESADVSKEITNVALLRANANSKFTEGIKSNIMTLVLAVIIEIIIYILIWEFFIHGTSKIYRKRINDGEKEKTIINEFRMGEIISTVLNCLLLFFTRTLVGITSAYCLIGFSIICFVFIFMHTTKIIKKQ